jgi:hypothetical protein
MNSLPRSCHLLLVMVVMGTLVTTSNGHGYLMTPQSRNYYAKTNGRYSCNSATEDCSDIPLAEDCPHCMNRADDGAVCGVKQDDPTRSYDTPKNVVGGSMPWITQASYQPGQVIDIDFVLTAHHKGHVSVYACPLTVPSVVPTKECFDKYPLEFISDSKYGAVKDSNYPERFYIAPPSVALEQRHGGSFYLSKMKLPSDVSGRVVLQWRYYTANSCVYPGYSTYAWPATWGGATNNVGSLGECPSPLPDFGSAPERFWNCADVMIGTDDNPPVASPIPVPVPAPIPAPVPTPPVQPPVILITPVDVPTPRPPSLRPTTVRPTPTPTGSLGACCRNNSTGLKAANVGCTGFVSCVDGRNYGYNGCPSGLIFNERLQVCDYRTNVPSCSVHCTA